MPSVDFRRDVAMNAQISVDGSQAGHGRVPAGGWREPSTRPLNFVFEATVDLLTIMTILNNGGPWHWKCKKDCRTGYCIEAIVDESNTSHRIRIHGDYMGNGARFYVSLGPLRYSEYHLQLRDKIEDIFVTRLIPSVDGTCFRVAKLDDYY